jgi:mRNA interferase MazF
MPYNFIERFNKLLEWNRKKIVLDYNSSIASATPKIVDRGSVYYCHFGTNIGSEQENRRPCVVLQRDSANQKSPNTIVAPITHTTSSVDVVIPISPKYDPKGILVLDGNVLLGNIVTVSKSRLENKITKLTESEMKLVDQAIIKSLGLVQIINKYENIIKNKDSYIAILKTKIAK